MKSGQVSTRELRYFFVQEIKIKTFPANCQVDIFTFWHLIRSKMGWIGSLIKDILTCSLPSLPCLNPPSPFLSFALFIFALLVYSNYPGPGTGYNECKQKVFPQLVKCTGSLHDSSAQKKVLCGRRRQVDFPSEQEVFHSHIPLGQGMRQVVCWL